MTEKVRQKCSWGDASKMDRGDDALLIEDKILEAHIRHQVMAHKVNDVGDQSEGVERARGVKMDVNNGSV
jgi:hypothetical protein